MDSKQVAKEECENMFRKFVFTQADELDYIMINRGKNVNTIRLNELIRDANWSKLYRMNNVDEMWRSFYDVFNCCFDRSNKRNFGSVQFVGRDQWLTPNIVSMSKEKVRLEKLLKKEKYYSEKKQSLLREYRKNKEFGHGNCESKTASHFSPIVRKR